MYVLYILYIFCDWLWGKYKSKSKKFYQYICQYLKIMAAQKGPGTHAVSIAGEGEEKISY